MTSQNPETEDILANHYFCGECGAFLLLDVLCPWCQPSLDDSSDAEETVRTWDVVQSVLMAIVVLVMTLPTTTLFLVRVFPFGFSLLNVFPFALLSVWNGYLLGYPVLILTRRWHHRIRHGQFGYAWIWGHYWRLQLHAIAPLLIIAAFPVLIAIGFWVSTFMR